MDRVPNHVNRHRSVCSLPELKTCFVDYDGSRSVSESGSEASAGDRGHDASCELDHLEKKIDRLSDLYLEQCELLTDIKNEIHTQPLVEKSDIQSKVVNELLKKALSQSKFKELNSAACDSEVSSDADIFSSRARSLLNAIEIKQAFCLDQEIRDALVDLLQSDELKEQMVAATVESVRDMLRAHFSRDMSNIYLPLLERAHRRLAKHGTRVLEAAFIELEENTSWFSNSIYKSTRSVRRTLERHQALLEEVAESRNRCNDLHYVVEEVLQKEFKLWRQQALDALCSVPRDIEPEFTPEPEPIEYSPVSPPQPADPEVSIIDQLMKTAEINKQIQDGDINGSFEKALSAGDLALVMAACRGVEPAAVFAPPCRLTQPVVLSLLQQLATDMVHDTQLKCRYLEEALINLNTSNPGTRAHLPVVVGEVRKHLTKFLSKYPSHVASRRITLIIMAADNLLK